MKETGTRCGIGAGVSGAGILLLLFEFESWVAAGRSPAGPRTDRSQRPRGYRHSHGTYMTQG
ncbi:hypothetical protein ACFVW2_38465, partial [Streptomyces sp. NPDC058171]